MSRSRSKPRGGTDAFRVSGPRLRSLLRRSDLRLKEIGKFDFGGEFLGPDSQLRGNLTFNSNWSFSARLFDIVNVETKVSYAHDVEDFQYSAAAITAGGANRYVMGRMNQQTLSTTVRFDINLTPELSLSYYGSPFVSTGRFSQFKLVTNPRASQYDGRFRRLDATTVFDAASNSYQVSDSGGAFTFTNPDFSWRELNSNLVLR